MAFKPLPGESCALNVAPGQSGDEELQVSWLGLLHYFSDLAHVNIRQGVLFPQEIQRERAVCRMDHYPELITGTASAATDTAVVPPFTVKVL